MLMTQFNSLFDLHSAFPTEQHAIDHLRAMRWGKDDEFAYCPHCGHTKVYHFKDNKTHKCGKCRKRFSIKVGSIFEDSKIPLRKWFVAVWLLTSHKKGIASTQLAKDIGVSQKTAWFMTHRLRHASQTASFNAPLDGDVEVDETFVGGKAKNMHAKDRAARKQYKNKATVVGVVKRDGDARAHHVPAAKKHHVVPVVQANVATDARFITDASRLYTELSSKRGGDFTNHKVVNHHAGEYVIEGDVHTNSVEGLWAIVKRQIIGTHHWVSKKHLQAYLNEITWRHNRRDQEEGQRVNNMLKGSAGRLTYKELTA